MTHYKIGVITLCPHWCSKLNVWESYKAIFEVSLELFLNLKNVCSSGVWRLTRVLVLHATAIASEKMKYIAQDDGCNNGLKILSVVYLCDFTQGSVTPRFDYTHSYRSPGIHTGGGGEPGIIHDISIFITSWLVSFLKTCFAVHCSSLEPWGWSNELFNKCKHWTLRSLGASWG